MRTIGAVFAGWLSLTACGTSTEVSGTMQGNTLQAKEAISFVSGSTALIYVTDYTGACSVAAANEFKASSQDLSFFVEASDAGTYYYGLSSPSALFNAQYEQRDATCSLHGQESPLAGLLTLTHVDGSGVAGSFDLFMGSAGTDHVTGSFSATNCPGLDRLRLDAGCQ